jgi:hypothetical protein
MLQKNSYGAKFDEKKQQASLKEVDMPGGDISFGNPMRRRRDG